MDTRRWVRVSVNGFLLVFGLLAVGLWFSLERKWIGEQFIRNAVSYDISARVRYARQPLPQAVRDVLEKTLQPEDGGIIAVGADGTIVTDFNTVGMCRAAADSNGRFEVKLAR